MDNINDNISNQKSNSSLKMKRLHTVLRENKRYYKYPLLLFAGYLLSSSMLLGKISPFCTALIGSLSGIDCVFAFIGSVVGFAMNGEIISSFPNIIAMTAIGVFRIFTGHNYASWVNITTSLLTGVCVFFATVLAASKPSDMFIAVVFGIAAGAAVYSLILFYHIITSERLYTLLKPSNTAALGLVYAFFISILGGFEYIVLNMGIIVSVLVTLVFAGKFRYAGGAVSGVIAALGMSIANSAYAEGALIICAAGLSSALFIRLGKITQAAGFIMVSGVCCAILGIDEFNLNVMAGVLVGGVLYMVLPTDLLTIKFRRTPAQKAGTDVSEIFAERLKLTGAAMGDVKLAVEKTAEILDRRGSRNMQWVYISASDSVCKKCRNSMKCWGENYDKTASFMTGLVKELRKGTQLNTESLSNGVLEQCDKKDKLIHALNMQYREYTETNTANRKITEMREILLAQLSVTESMMRQMADEFKSTDMFDRVMASRLEQVVMECGIEKVKTAVSVNSGRISAEVYGQGRLIYPVETVCDRVSAALKCQFDLPDIINNGKDFRMTMFEKAVYSIEYGVYQMNRGGMKNCGDYCESFIDGKGYAYVVLSDGMGSGGRARIDSAFACGMLVKLLRANIGIETAIEMINNSLLVKSADESFATLDICKIDLYSGQALLYKAGGAPTYIKCNKRVVKANGRGLPVGIKRKPVYESQSFVIGNSDVLIMASDGAEISERWLEHELSKEEYAKSSMDDIAEKIATAARFAEEKGREDDISVIAVKLVK